MNLSHVVCCQTLTKLSARQCAQSKVNYHILQWIKKRCYNDGFRSILIEISLRNLPEGFSGWSLWTYVKSPWPRSACLE